TKPITMIGDGGGWDRLEVDEFSAPGPATYSLSGNALSRSGSGTLFVQGSTEQFGFYPAPGSTVQVLSPSIPTTLYLRGQTAVNVQSTSTDVDVFGWAGTGNSVTIGSNGTLNNILGKVWFHTGGGGSSSPDVIIDDSANIVSKNVTFGRICPTCGLSLT